METFQTLYKRTAIGAVQIWFMEIDGCRYRSISGQIDGKKVTTEWTTAKPKNEGRTNATTAEEQAVAEVNAEYKKKLKRDYHKSLDAIDTQMRFKPMLADKWGDRKAKVTDDYVHMQPKLDGIRCIAKADGLWTRNGECILGAPHIHEQLKPLFDKMPDLIIDGELYNHEYKDDFNAIVSCVKKTKPTEDDLKLSAERIQYWIYDMPSDAPFSERHKIVQNIIDIGLVGVTRNSIVIVPTDYVHKDDVDSTAAIYIEAGYEGAMIRLPGKYENKRSKTLLKWKEFQDEEFPIVDIQEGDGNRSGMAARVVLALPDGRHFSSGIIGNVEYCKRLLAEKDNVIGKMATIVFQHYTPDGVPRFPKFKAVRDYE